MNKTNKKKIVIPAGVILIIIAALFVSYLKWEPKPDPASEKFIREIVGKQMNKEPYSLTDEDFAKITYITITNTKLLDIKLLEKFTNLKEFRLGLPIKRNIPKWKSILARIGIYDTDKNITIDLRPLENLINLKRIVIVNTQVRDIKPLVNKKNLIDLELNNTQVSNIKPLENLTNLQNLDISGTMVSNIKPLANLTNLITLNISRTQVSDIEPIANLTNLGQLNISNTQVSNIKPLANLENLQELQLVDLKVNDISALMNLKNLKFLTFGTYMFSDEQVAELLKALPNLRSNPSDL